jgi:hypothetical protein
MLVVVRACPILAALAAPAWADSEQALSGSLTYATFSVPGKAMNNMPPPSLSPTVGFALAGSYERAIGSDLALRLEGAGGLFFGGQQKAGDGDRSYAVLGDAGVTFRFDVFKYVPYAFAGLGAVWSTGKPLDLGGQPVFVIGGGCDELFSREHSIGVEARLASFGGDLTVFTVGLRGTVRWGFF